MTTVLTPIERPASAPVRPAAGAPLSAQQLQALEQAGLRARKVRNAGRMAMFNGCAFGAFAGLSLLFAALSPLFGEFDVVATVMAGGLGIVAWNEFRGRRLLCRFDLGGPRLLGWNQLALMALLMAYCAWSIHAGLTAPDPYAREIAAHPQIAPTLGTIGRLKAILTVAIYGGLVAFSLVFQGLTALYYFTRGKLVRAYLSETPAWIVEVQRRSSVG